MTLLELNFQRRKARRTANDLLDKAALESRDLTISERIQFDSLTARIQELDEQFVKRSNLRKVAF